MQGGVYCIRNIANGHCYIGSTSNFRRRWQDHQRRLINGNHDNRHLQSAYNCYGTEAFVYEMIEIIEDAMLLLEREQYWIDTHKPIYNLCPVAGTRRGAKLTPEQVERLRQRALNQSPETRAKIAEKMKARRLTPEHKARVSEAKRHQSPETRAKIAEAQRNRSPEIVAVISQKLKGRKAPERERRLVSEKAKERWQDPVYRAKMIEALKKKGNKKTPTA